MLAARGKNLAEEYGKYEAGRESKHTFTLPGDADITVHSSSKNITYR